MRNQLVDLPSHIPCLATVALKSELDCFQLNLIIMMDISSPSDGVNRIFGEFRGACYLDFEPGSNKKCQKAPSFAGFGGRRTTFNTALIL